MQCNVNEFVFQRRRKRLRTDFEDAEIVTSSKQANDGLPSGLVPEVAVLSEPPTSSPAILDNPQAESPNSGGRSESLVTVEKFLRRSVQKAPKTKQTLSAGIPRKIPRAYIRHRPSERRTAVDTHKQPKESSRTAQALFRAAVLTGGDPIDTLANDAGISLTRRPLVFVPFNKFADSPRRGRTHPVDAGSGKNATSHTRRLDDASDLEACRHRCSRSHRRRPLRLVPFQEAETAYSIIFPSRLALLKHA